MHTRKTLFASDTARRLAWLEAGIAFVGAAIPLALKGTANLVNGMITFDVDSLKEAGRNLGSAVALPLAGGATAVASVFSPDIGGSSLRKKIFSARDYYFKFEVEQKKEKKISLPEGTIFKKIKSQDFLVDIADIPCETKSTHTRILFFGQGGFYQYYYERIAQENKALQCNTRAFNYPGSTRSEKVESIYNLVKSGIDVLEDFMEEKNWTADKLALNTHLDGRSMGGAIALYVAYAFKQIYKVDLRVVVDRSFSSFSHAMAGQVNHMTGLPTWYARWLCSSLMTASGGWDMNPGKILSLLKPGTVYIFNLAHRHSTMSRTCAERMRKFLGLGAQHQDADSKISDDCALLNYAEAKKIVCDSSTKLIRKNCEIKLDQGQLEKNSSCRLYAERISVQDHDVGLSELHIYPEIPSYSGLFMYRRLQLQVRSNDVSPSSESKHVIPARS